MKKQLVRILFGLLLGLCLLPATALAEGEDAPYTLYVGNQQVIVAETVTYWAIDDSGGLIRLIDATDDSADWSVKYDPNTATLTLRGATINGAYDATSLPYGAGIYAQCRSNQSVALTIELIGTNTITGNYGIYVHANQGTPSGADASLVIKNGGDNGSLTVTGTTSYGLYVVSGTGNASLTINDASVVASSSSSIGAAGVCVQSGASATNSPELSLAVNGGSLTASASEGNDGIQFYVGSSEATGATTSLTVSENAIVDAKSGGISATQIMSQIDTTISTTGTNGGIVFDGTEGAVYGAVTLDESLTINKGETLTIPKGSKLDCNNNLTNSGTIAVQKGGTLVGKPGGDGKTETVPEITAQPRDRSVNVGNAATFTVKATGENLSYQWQERSDNSVSTWQNISGATDATYTMEAATRAKDGYQYRCVVSNKAGFVNSNAVELTVKQPVTGVKLDKTTLNLIVGDTATLKATVEPTDAADQTVTWASSDDKIAAVDNSGKVTAVGPGTATITATAADGSGKSASCTVTVTAKTYCLSIDPGAVGFGTMAPGYTQPAVQEVTVKNTGNQTLSLTHPTAVHFEVGKLNQLTLAPGEKAMFTVRPKAGLPLGSYRETVVVKASGGVEVSVNLTFAVSDGGTGNEKCTLHFNTMGGLPLDDVVRGLGAPVELWPYTPVRAGYLFMGWYSDEALTKAVNTVVLVDDTTVYAKWAVDPAATAAQSGSGTGGSSTGSGSGSGSKATPTPTPTATPAPTPTATPTPAPTATPESTPEVTPAPEETPEKGGFPVFPVAAGGIILVAAAGVFFLLNRRR